MYKAVRSGRSKALALLTSAAIALPLTMMSVAPAQADEVTLVGVGDALTAAVEETPEFSALLFTKTAAFRHGNIPTAVAAVEQLGVEHNFTVEATEDAAAFTDENLEQYDVVIWLSTTGDVLDTTQQAAFERYIQAGGGYAGIHAASDTEYGWEWYEGLVGAYFEGHPAQQNGVIEVEDHAHESTSHLGDTWARFDEWYDFQTNPRDDVHVLLSLDESSYNNGGMGDDHPIAWCNVYDGGRSWYTAGGHTDAAFAEPDFLTHVLEGVRTAAGVVDSDCSASQSDSYELVTLADDTGNPMSLEIADDGTVFYVERNGRIQRIDADTQQRTTALTLSVTLGNEDGLLGAVLDPDFAENGWMYVYWSPSSVSAEDGPHNRISRFTYDGAIDAFDPTSEQTLLKITTQRDECCHAGGDMVFDLDGNLVLATGDNTNPFASNGFSPIDERDGRSAWDAQRTSGNTNDLRGKVIRITPQDNGTYTIPAGNLFDEAADTNDQTRPEVYAMGFRNPFRIGLDPFSGNILVADYGPDSGSSNASRGPAATTEWNIVDEPGNYGWPYCTGETCYIDYDFETSTSGERFDPNALVNDSPGNTGLSELPPVITPEYWGVRNANDNPFPEIGAAGYTGAPMGGPVYAYDPELDSDTKWPEYWDGKAFFGDWNLGEAFSITMNEDTAEAPLHSEIVGVTRMLPGILDPDHGFYRVMDAQWGPDGSLYVIDWGQGFGGNNSSSGVYRIDYVKGNPSPIARATADKTNGSEETLTVQFSSEGSRHPSGEAITYLWDFGDGSATTDEQNPQHTYTGYGEYTASLTVSDAEGQSAIASINLVVGNVEPTVNIVFPENGGFFEWGDEVAYQVVVDDPDGSGEIDCSQIEVLPALGHDSHQHPMGQLSGCEGSIPTGRDGGHGITEKLFWVVDVRYTDDGGAANVPLTGYGTNLLTPKYLEAEFFADTANLDGSDGVRTETTEDTGGGMNLSYVDVGDWWSYEPINFKGIDSVRARLAIPNGSGSISMRWNAPDGEELATIPFTSTGGWQSYRYFDVDLEDLPTETGTLYFVLTAGKVNVNYFEWVGAGVDANGLPVITLDADQTTGSSPLTVNATASAIDPEGGEVTLEWNAGLGDGFFEGDGEQQFVYTQAGQYVLTVRATDDTGATSEESVTITVEQPAVGVCFSGRSDDFLGEALDTDRWDSNVRLNQEAVVEDGHLVIPATKTDINGAGGDASNIILQELPDGAWQATAKVTFEATAQYQQAGLIVYGDDDNYAKMVLQARNTTGTRIFQFIREEAGVTNEVAASNTGNLGAAFPETYFVRFTSDGTSLNAWYSADGIDFTMMSQTKQLAGIENPRIGLAAFANSNSPREVVDAHFDWFHITPDDTASAATPNDEFDGDALDTCRWTVVDPEPEGFRVSDGHLEIDTTPEDIYTSATGAPNFIVQDQPGEEWTVETKVDASALDRRYQQAGLIVLGDDDNYVKIDLVSTNAGGSAVVRNLEMRSEIGGAIQTPQATVTGLSTDGNVWLRLSKAGDTFSGSYSTDGDTWIEMSNVMTNAPAAEGQVGVYALGNSSQGTVSRTARFDYFHVVEDAAIDPLEISSTLAPAEAGGADGWYTGPVTVEVSVTGGGESSVYREVNVNGSGWVEYTAPIEVTDDGEHTVEYRASSPEVDPVDDEVSFKIDATSPEIEASTDLDAQPRTIGLVAEDATSGIASIQYRLDDGEWIEYDAVVELSDDAQTITYRATDEAGNTSDEGSIEVPEVAEVDTERPVVVLVSPSTAGPFQELSVKVDATDNAGLHRVVANIYKDGLLVKSTQSVADGATEFSHSATVSLPDGSYSMKYNASDVAGNVSSTGVVSFTIDATVPTVTVKSGDAFTIGDAASGYEKLSLKLFDAGLVDRVEINGTVKDLTNAKWSDVNGIVPGAFGAVLGENTVVVFDVAGNTTELMFTLVEPAPAAPVWDASVVYNTGDEVTYNGATYVAQWWTRNSEPGTSTTGSWMQQGDLVPAAGTGVREWTASWVYTGGEVVAHNGHVWKAKWWTRNATPGASVWQDLGSY
ncbi:ThuA domain-containing protein [Microbacterium sp. R86528]|uniref:ThuA domain-containing protein n=1 Tax=Microbacterium sp. R86528 TaxID=3093864 RepID=UPI0037CC2675